MPKLNAVLLAETAAELFGDTGFLGNAVRQGWIHEKYPIGDLLDVINRLYEGDERLFVFNALAEIRAGLMKSQLVEGALSPGQEDGYTLEDYCVFGLWGNGIGFCPFTQKPYHEMYPVWRAIADGLPGSGTADPAVLETLALGQGKPRCVAVLTIGRRDDGGRVVHLHHHPSIGAETAAAFLKKCVNDTMSKAQG